MQLAKLVIFGAIAILCSGCRQVPQPPEEGMVPLFDGKTLNGFEVKNGTATYEVVDNTIVGTTAAESPNTFLCTTKDYGDFVLEFEVLVDPLLNSGVQIRSHQYKEDTPVVTVGDDGRPIENKHEAGRVHGYQVEISNEESGTSGGIYDEARRGWVDNIKDDPAASKAFKDNQWNKYRVEAVGDSIKTSVNGVPCADLVDSMDLSGFIGLQVHAYKGDQPAQVRWRDLWIKDLGEHVWEPIFDGQTLSGWMPTGGGKWTVEDGAIKGTNTRSGKNGLLVLDREMDDLTVRLKFRAAKGNSGLFFRMAEAGGSLEALEAEIDEKEYVGGYYEVGGRKYVVQPDAETVATYFKPGEWNDMTVSAHGRRLVFHVNGIKTVDLKDDPGRLTGKLALQVHGNQDVEMWFKEIEVLHKKR